MTPPQIGKGPNTDASLPSLYGPLQPVWMPAGLGFQDASELGMAMVAWRFNLTKANVATLALLAAGLSNRQIADRQGLDDTTVKNHVQAVLDALNVPNRTAAAAIALRYGIESEKEHGFEW